MKSEDIVIGEEYFVDLNHEDAWHAFSDDVDRGKSQVVKVIGHDELPDGCINYIVKMVNIEYPQTIGLKCFIKSV